MAQYKTLDNFANQFSTSTNYAVGDLCMYLGELYVCSTTHPAGAWNSSHFTKTNVGTLMSNAGMSNPMTTAGDIIVGSSGTPTRLGVGSNGYLLGVDYTGALAYGNALPIITTAPNSANTNGLIICVLNDDTGITKYAGYLYIITQAQTLISFTIGITYQAESGMTWAQWCASNYNTGGYQVSGNLILSADGRYFIQDNTYTNVSPTDTILDNGTYHESAGGGGD